MMRGLTRTWLLRGSLSGLTYGGLFCAVLATSCRVPPQNHSGDAWQRFEFSQPEMGVPFRIILYAENERQAVQAARAAFDRIAQLNQIFSDYDTDSELNLLAYRSGSGEDVAVSADLWNVLRRAQALAAETSGGFDVTVGPYVGLWRKARREHALPEPRRLQEAATRVGYQHVTLNPELRTVRLDEKNMRLDLGGIAKGYALDAALRVCEQEFGLHRVLVTGGGDMAAGEAPPGRDGWRIQVAALDAPEAPEAQVVLLRRQGLATSGDVFQRLEIDGRRYSHIVDPRTGLGLLDQSQVTVVGPDGMTADSLATAVSVLGPEEGLRLIESKRGVECYIVRKPVETFETYRSSGFDTLKAP